MWGANSAMWGVNSAVRGSEFRDVGGEFCDVGGEFRGVGSVFCVRGWIKKEKQARLMGGGHRVECLSSSRLSSSLDPRVSIGRRRPRWRWRARCERWSGRRR
eukprot:621006-Prorocentrum_minimum.AAC.1